MDLEVEAQEAETLSDGHRAMRRQNRMAAKATEAENPQEDIRRAKIQ